MFRRNPGFSAAAVLTLALGIGCNTGVFSFVDAWILTPAPFNHSEQLTLIRFEDRMQKSAENLAPADFADFRDDTRAAFQSVAGFVADGFNLSGPGLPAERILGARVSPAFFDVFRVQPAQGRGFIAEEEQGGHGQVAVLSDGLWKRRYAADRNIVGKNIRLDGVDYRVVGIMAENFHVSMMGPLNIWVPLVLGPRERQNRKDRSIAIFARLRPEVTAVEARSMLDGFARKLESEFPVTHAHLGFRLRTYAEAVARQSGENGMRVLVGVVGCLLLIACTNVANLILARSIHRRREIAVRLALGAGRLRLVRQLMTESLVLFLAGGVVSLVVAEWMTQGTASRLPESMLGYLPNYGRVQVNYEVLAYTLAIALSTGLAFSIGPALRTVSVGLSEVLKETSRGASGGHRVGRWRDALVIAEIAMTLMVSIVAGLLCRNVIAIYAADPGFDSRNVYLGRLSLPENQYPSDERVRQFCGQLLSRTEAMPGVAMAAIAEFPPFGGLSRSVQFDIDGETLAPGEVPPALFNAVSHTYLHVLGLRVLRGRGFDERDREGQPEVALVNQAFARRYFRGQDAVGHMIRLIGSDRVPIQIVGMLEDTVQFELGEDPEPILITSYRQFPTRDTQLLVRALPHSGNTAASAMRAAVASLDVNLALARVAPVDTLIAEEMAPQKLMAQWIVGFAALALLLSLVGIYGVVRYTVESRTQEFGIRVALGADRIDILRQASGRGIWLVTPGIALGLLGAFASSVGLRSVLTKISPTDPLSLAAATTIFTVIALFACLAPAHRATKIDPVQALRYE